MNGSVNLRIFVAALGIAALVLCSQAGQADSPPTVLQQLAAQTSASPSVSPSPSASPASLSAMIVTPTPQPAATPTPNMNLPIWRRYAPMPSPSMGGLVLPSPTTVPTGSAPSSAAPQPTPSAIPTAATLPSAAPTSSSTPGAPLSTETALQESSSMGPGDQMLIAQVLVNSVPAHDALIVVRDHDALIRASDRTGIPFPANSAEIVIKGTPFLSLANAHLQYAFDPSNISLNISYTVATHKALHFDPIIVPAYEGVRTPFLTYNGVLDNGGRVAFSTTTGIAGPRDILNVGFINDGSTTTRSVMQYQYRTGDNMGIWTLGDQYDASGLGSSTRPFFGLGFSRGEDNRDNYARMAPQTVIGVCQHPCTMTVDTHDHQHRTLEMEPGNFAVGDVPINALIDVRDDVTQVPVQFKTERPEDGFNLRKGFTRYDVEGGLTRTCIYECARYSGFLAQGSVLHGVTSWFTLGGDMLLTEGSGFDVDAILSDTHRQLRLSMGAGPRASDLLLYSEQHNKWWWSASYGLSGAPYYNENLQYTTSGRSRTENVGIGYSGTSIGMNETFQNGSSAYRQWTISQRVRVGNSAVFVTLLNGIASGSRSTSVHLSVPLQLFKRGQPTMATVSFGGGTPANQQLYQQINTPSGANFGLSSYWRQSQIGYTTDSFQTTLSGMGLLSFNGGLGFLHGIHPLSMPENGYVVALGQPGDTILDDQGQHHTIGHSGEHAFPTRQNDDIQHVNVQQRDSITDIAFLDDGKIHPAPYSGQIIQVRHDYVHAVIGTLGQNAAFGEIDVDENGKTESSPLGSDGGFYFENLPQGTWHAHATIPGGTCTVILRVPVSKAPQIDLGLLPCQVQANKPSTTTTSWIPTWAGQLVATASDRLQHLFQH